MSTIINQKELIEEVGVRIEKYLGISPISARIYALLRLSSNDGLTFEEIRKTINASKSCTSVNLNVLQTLGYLDVCTKIGDRKRYFKVAKYYHLQALELYYQSLRRDMDVIEKINIYNKENHPDKFSKEKSLGEISITYIQKMQELVQETIKKFSSFQDTN